MASGLPPRGGVIESSLPVGFCCAGRCTHDLSDGVLWIFG